MRQVRYAALWLRERFWRAAMVWQTSGSGAAGVARLLKRGRAARPNAVMAQDVRHAVTAPIRVVLHVRRGDVFYLGPKTGRPHPHWVDSETVLEMMRGVRQALGVPLEAPRVQVDLYTEKGWLHNDTAALRALAPTAIIHIDSKPSATVDALIAMASADLLVMGSSGFSLWAGIFSCGVKVGPPMHEGLPMRFVSYASTITTRKRSFEDEALEPLRRAWAEYSSCRQDPGCGKTLCSARHVASQWWGRSGLARDLIQDAAAVQWQLPAVLDSSSFDRVQSASAATSADTLAPLQGVPRGLLRRGSLARARCGRTCGPALNVMWGSCYNKSTDAREIVGCVRARWQGNLSLFLQARKRLPNYPGSMGRSKPSRKSG